MYFIVYCAANSVHSLRWASKQTGKKITLPYLRICRFLRYPYFIAKAKVLVVSLSMFRDIFRCSVNVI